MRRLPHDGLAKKFNAEMIQILPAKGGVGLVVSAIIFERMVIVVGLGVVLRPAAQVEIVQTPLVLHLSGEIVQKMSRMGRFIRGIERNLLDQSRISGIGRGM